MIAANPDKSFQVAAAVCEGHHWVVKSATVGSLGDDLGMGVTGLHTWNSIGSGISARSAEETAAQLPGVAVVPGMRGIVDRTDTQHDADSCGARAVGRLLDMHDGAHGRPIQHRDHGDRAAIRAWMDARVGVAPAFHGSAVTAQAKDVAYDAGDGAVVMVTRQEQEAMDAKLAQALSRQPEASFDTVKRQVLGSRPFQAAHSADGMRTGLSAEEAATLRGSGEAPHAAGLA